MTDHLGRIADELRDAEPTTIVTLGNAALRVMRELLPTRTASSRDCRHVRTVGVCASSLDGRKIAWYPLVHPGGRGPVKEAHAEWTALRSDRVAVAARGVCPACGGRGLVPIAYGMPGSDLLEESRVGRIAIGGCVSRATIPIGTASSADPASTPTATSTSPSGDDAEPGCLVQSPSSPRSASPMNLG